jgi:hypothetical protein
LKEAFNTEDTENTEITEKRREEKTGKSEDGRE